MTEDNATRAELLEALAAQVARLVRAEAEVHRLRDALKDIESPPIDVLCHGSWEAAEWMIERAANALKESDRD